MPNYDFSKVLSPERFQDFTRDILQVREKNVMESFRKTKDNGIDMRTKKDKKTVIGQAKRYSNINSLMNNLRNVEINKVKKLNPDRYILVSSVDYDNKSKEEIIKLFEGYIKNEKDIIGNTDLNNLLNLKGYEKIEENYPELWFNSSRVFEYILEKILHRKIYNASKEEFRNIKENEKTYIEDDVYFKAKNTIDTYNFLLVTGEAGIGKTSLARHVCNEYVKKGYKFVYAYDINDIWDSYSNNPQIFFIDDFWGSIFKEKTDKTQEKKFKDFIEVIGKRNDKKLVLTSREYIIEKGFREHPKIGDCLDTSKVILKLEDYSEQYKAKIFLKHIEQSDLDLKNTKLLINSCEEIINNNMYNPRLIAEFIQRASRQTKLDKNYNCYVELKKYLKNPESFIKDVFDEQTEVGKLLLILLLSRNRDIEVNMLKKYYYEYLNVDKELGKKEEFESAMKQISNDLVRLKKAEYSTKNEISILVSFLNPSVKEFIYKYFLQNLERYAQNIIESTSSLELLLCLSTVISYKLENKEIQDMIFDKIIKEYDNLEYNFTKSELYSKLITKESEFDSFTDIIHMYQDYPSIEKERFLQNKISDMIYKVLTGEYKLQYEDRISLPAMLEAIIESKLNVKLDAKRLIEIYYNSIEHCDEFDFMEEQFADVFPEEIYKFMRLKRNEIKSKLPKILMQDAIHYSKMGYDRELEKLIELDYPLSLEYYNFKSSKRFENNLKYLSKHLYKEIDGEEKGKDKMEFNKMLEEEKNKIIKNKLKC